MSQNFLFKTSKSETKVLLKSSNNFADTSPIQIIKKEEIIEKKNDYSNYKKRRNN